MKFLIIVLFCFLMFAVDLYFENNIDKASEIYFEAVDGEVESNGFKYYFNESDDSFTFVIGY